MKSLTFKVFAAIALSKVRHEERSPKFRTNKKYKSNLAKTKIGMEKINKCIYEQK